MDNKSKATPQSVSSYYIIRGKIGHMLNSAHNVLRHLPLFSDEQAIDSVLVKMLNIIFQKHIYS